MLTYLFTQTPLLFLVQSFWRDEAFTYLISKHSVLEICNIAARDFSPPLYYILMHFWMMLFGHSEIAMRSLSFVSYWGIIYVVYLILTDIMKLSVKKAQLYLLFFVFNPLLVYYAFEARMYALFGFFAALSFYAFYKKNMKLYIFATIAGLYTHYFMVFVVATHLLYAALTQERKRDIIFSIKDVAIPLTAFVPWFLYMMSLKPFLSESFWIPAVNFYDLLVIPGVLYTGFERLYDGPYIEKTQFGIQLLIISIIIIFITIIGFNKLKAHNKPLPKVFLYLLLWAFAIPILIYIVSFFKPTFLPRYLIFANIGITLLCVYIIEQMRKGAKIGFIVLLIIFTYLFQNISIQNRTKANFSQAMKEVQALMKPGDLIYTDELDFHTAEYYAGEDRVFIYGKTHDELPSYVGKVLMPKEKIAMFLPRYPQKAFVMHNDGSYDIESTR